jgi:hypothetical protein
MKAMIFYEVSVEVRADLQSAFVDYMRNKHIPEIWATACFAQIRFDKANETLYRTCYQSSTAENYERYIAEHATAMRADFMQHFPEGCVASRLVYSDLQTWP